MQTFLDSVKMKSLTLIIALAAVLVNGQESTVKLQNNGYVDVVVAISPSISEAEGLPLIERIKDLFNEASPILYNATRKMAYFKNISILVPQGWTRNDSYTEATFESFGTADVRIDSPNPSYGDCPNTLQPLPCGMPGLYIHLTPNYLKNLEGNSTTIFGNPGKTLVHEWAHFRYGVFNEFGSADDPDFPLFYYNDRQDLVPNICTNKKVKGINRDSVTRGPCKYGDDGLPDKNCYFDVNLHNNSEINTSLASLHFLPNVTVFCDDEHNNHNKRAPTPHNLFCDQNSTWDVIRNHEDFLSTEPATVKNLKPTFEVVQQMESNTFSLVLDVSGSMNENDESRLTMLRESATRWLKYDVKDGAAVGIILFSDKEREAHAITPINSSTRQQLINTLPTSARGGTCIGCGLRMALQKLKAYRKRNGGTIIILTDGDENGFPKIAEVIPNIKIQKVRVIAIALQTSGSTDLEVAATQTGGKLFNIPAKASPQALETAFHEATTVQSTDINFSVKLHDKYFSENSKMIKGYFVIEDSLGNNTIVNVVYGNRANLQNITIKGPKFNASIENALDDQVTKLLRFNFKQLQPGKYEYNISLSGSNAGIGVVVSSSPREKNQKPITTRSWTATEYFTSGSKKIPRFIIYAEVKQGNNPVINAAVVAAIGKPDNTLDQLQLFDNGAAPDIARDDGIYSNYFTKFGGQGRYTVQAQVTDDGKAAIRESGFIASRAMPVIPTHLASQNVKSKPTGSFERIGDSISLSVPEMPPGDYYPPSAIRDLKANVSEDNKFVTLAWTAPGDDLTTGNVSDYIIKYSESWEDINDAFNGTTVNLSDFTPRPAGEKEIQVTTLAGLEPDSNFYLGIKGVDKSNNEAKLSNIVVIRGRSDADPSDAGGSNTTTIVAVTVSVLLIAIIAAIAAVYKHKQRSEHQSV